MEMDTGNSLLETQILTAEEKAELKKEEGNIFFKEKSYREALQLYSEAISLYPTNSAYYGNRAACYIMLGFYKYALEDSRWSTKYDPEFVKGYLREAKCHIALGDVAAAAIALEKVKQLDPRSDLLQTEINNLKTLQLYEDDALKAYEKKDYRKAVYCVDRAVPLAISCPRLRLLKAECLAYLGRYQEAQELANDVLQVDKMNVEALYVRGICLYSEDNVDKAMAHFQEVIRLAPDHIKAKDAYRKAKQLKIKKEEGNEAFKSGKLQEAYDIYTEGLNIDPNNIFTNAKIYCNRAVVCSRLNKHNQAVEDCTCAIKLDENYVKAYLRRAKCYMDLEMYEEAVRDYEKVYKMDKTRENKELLHEAKIELKKSKRKDYYKILGVNRSATDDDIKKAYKKRAMVHHPDRHANALDEIRKEQEKKFKEVGEAYGVLSDPKKRSRYDNGHDLEDMDGFGDIDPNNVFQAFFSGPGHFTFPGGSHGESFSSFPGGFSFQFG